MVFDSKQFQIRKDQVAIAKWTGPKDEVTLGELLRLFIRERWRGQLQVNFPGNGGINDIVFTEKPSVIKPEE